MNADAVRSSYLHLVFTESGAERLEDVLDLLDDLEAHENPLAARAREEFERRLNYLDEYGGPVSPEDPRRRYKVSLGGDWAPFCFTVTWHRIELRTGDYIYAMNGGLIWHGGPFDSMVVSLTPMLWGIHT